MCVLLTVILSGSLFSGVVFADDEPKTMPAKGEQPKLAQTLEAIADRIEGRPPQVGLFAESLARLERAARTYEGSEPQPATADRFQAFVSLHRRIESLTSSLQKEIANAV